MSITVDDAFPPEFQAMTSNGTSICSGTEPVQLAATNLIDVNYSWRGPNSFQSSGRLTSITNPLTGASLRSGIYTVTATKTSGGCTATATVSVTIKQSPTAGIATSTANLTCASLNVTRTATGGGTYVWSPSGGSTAVGSFSSPGIYKVTVTGTNGCTATTQVTQDITAPTPGITGTDVLTCSLPTVTRTATGGGTYVWSPSGGSTAVGSFSSPGIYKVTVTGTNGCTATATTSVTQNIVTPTASITGSANLTCATAIVTRTASGGDTYQWSNGLGTNAIANITVPGTYTVTITGANGCTATATTSVTQNITAPTASISGSDNLTCSTTSVIRTASGGDTYLWSNGLGTNATANITAPGTYTVTITGANGCTATATTIVTQNITATTASISGADNLTCSVTTVTRTASGGETYLWSNGLGTNAIANITAPGTYTVTITGTNGCSATATTSVTQNITVPTASISGIDILTCTTTSVTRTASGGDTYLWSNSLGTSATANITTPGNYTVTVTGGNGCTTTATTSVTMNNLLSTTIESNSPICVGKTLNLSASGGSSYSWSGPNSFSSAEQNPGINNVTSAAAGTYTVTITSNGCTATATTSVVVNDLPSILISTNSPVCAGQDINLSASGGNAYSWTGPGSFSSNSSTPTITNATLAMSGVYTVYVTGTNNCTMIATTSVTINPKPEKPTLSTPTEEICISEGNSYATLYANGCTGMVIWENGETGSSITIQVIATDYYRALCKVGNCSSDYSDPLQITVKTKPLAPVVTANKTAYCSGDEEGIILKAVGCNGTILWNSGVSSSTITVSPTTATSYSVTCTNDCGTSVAGTYTVNVNSLSPPTILQENPIVCGTEGNTILTASDCNGTFQWSTNATGSAITVTQAGTYSVKCINANGCESQWNNIEVKFSINPNITINHNSPSLDETLFFVVESNDIDNTFEYTWNGPNNFTGTGKIIYIEDVQEANFGLYTATVTNAEGCSATSTTIVTLNPCNLNIKSFDSGLNIETNEIFQSICSASSLTLSVIDANDNSFTNGQFNWSVPTSISVNTSASEISINKPGVYSVNVIPFNSNKTCHLTIEIIQKDSRLLVNNSSYQTILSGGVSASSLLGIDRVRQSNQTSTSEDILATVIPIKYYGENLLGGCLGLVTWYKEGNLIGSGSTLEASPVVTTRYTASCNNPQCETPIDITVLPCKITIATSTKKTQVNLGEEITLKASGCSAGTITWDTGETTNEISVVPLEDKVYQATCSTNACQGSINIVVNVKNPPDIKCEPLTIASDKTTINRGENNTVNLVVSGCSNGDVTWATLPANSPAVSWLSKTKSDDGIDKAEVNVTNAVTFTATCVKPGFSNIAPVSITINATLSFTVDANPNPVNEGNSTKLTATCCSGGTITWNTGETSNTSPFSISKTINQPTRYTATCVASGLSPIEKSVQVNIKSQGGVVIEKSECSAFRAYVYPRNLDLIADAAFPPGTELYLYAADCPGKVVWTTNNDQLINGLYSSPVKDTNYQVVCYDGTGASASICASNLIRIYIVEPFNCDNFKAEARLESVSYGVQTSNPRVFYNQQSYLLKDSGCINGEVQWSDPTGIQLTSTSTTVSSNVVIAKCKIRGIVVCDKNVNLDNAIIGISPGDNGMSLRIAAINNQLKDDNSSMRILNNQQDACGSVALSSAMNGYLKLLCQSVSQLKDAEGNISQQKAEAFVELTEEALQKQPGNSSLVFANKEAIIAALVAGNCGEVGTRMAENFTGDVIVSAYNAQKNDTYPEVLKEVVEGMLLPGLYTIEFSDPDIKSTNRTFKIGDYLVTFLVDVTRVSDREFVVNGVHYRPLVYSNGGGFSGFYDTSILSTIPKVDGRYSTKDLNDGHGWLVSSSYKHENYRDFVDNTLDDLETNFLDGFASYWEILHKCTSTNLQAYDNGIVPECLWNGVGNPNFAQLAGMIDQAYRTGTAFGQLGAVGANMEALLTEYLTGITCETELMGNINKIVELAEEIKKRKYKSEIANWIAEKWTDAQIETLSIEVRDCQKYQKFKETLPQYAEIVLHFDDILTAQLVALPETIDKYVETIAKNLDGLDTTNDLKNYEIGKQIFDIGSLFVPIGRVQTVAEKAILAASAAPKIPLQLALTKVEIKTLTVEGQQVAKTVVDVTAEGVSSPFLRIEAKSGTYSTTHWTPTSGTDTAKIDELANVHYLDEQGVAKTGKLDIVQDPNMAKTITASGEVFRYANYPNIKALATHALDEVDNFADDL